MPEARRQPKPPDPALILMVLAAPKAVRWSSAQIVDRLQSDGHVTLPVDLPSGPLLPPDARVELNVYARSPLPTSWRISLKVNRLRVDGIDYHPQDVPGPEGAPLRGWHRHLLDQGADPNHTNRVPLPDPAPDGKIGTFLHNALAEMNVSTSGEVSHEQLDLGLDP